jgi:hypothetical protein
MATTNNTESNNTNRKTRQAKRRQGPGKNPMGLLGIAGVATYIILFTVVIISTLVVIWPPIRSQDVKRRLDEEVEQKITKRKEEAARQEAEARKQQEAEEEAAKARLNQTAAGATANANANSNNNANTNTNANSNTNKNANTNTNTNATAGTTSSGCSTDAIQEGFCLDAEGRPREGLGALWFWGCWRCIYDEDRLLLIVLLAGALGALVHAIRSLSWYVGNRQAVWSWSAMYFMLPFLGAGIAFIFYLVIRGGFFSPTSTVTDTSPFGFAALAALIGMFTEPAVVKLRKVATTILEPPEQGKDHVGPAPKLTEISPKQGLVGGGETVTITGENFASDVEVSFGGLAAEVTSSSPKSITVTTPAHAKGKVDVVVTNDDKQQGISKEGFEYVEPPNGGNGGGEGGDAGEEGEGEETNEGGETGEGDEGGVG